MNESTAKYLAGLLDADGSLSFAFKRDQNRQDCFYLSLALKLTASDNVDKHRYVENLPITSEMGSTSRYGPKRQFVVWNISKRADLEMLLPRLLKHMIIKAQHWQLLLDTWREERGHGINEDRRIALTALSKVSRNERIGPLKAKKYPAWAWVAGYLDGDGCYAYRSHVVKGKYRQWTINVSACAHVNDMIGLEMLLETFGGRIIPQGQSDVVMLWKRSLGYQNRSFALKFLGKMARYSKLKREKIDAMIHHHSQRLSVPGTEKTRCNIDRCKDFVHGNGLCSRHYQRQCRV